MSLYLVTLMTIKEYLETGGHQQPDDDVPTFVSPGWLRLLRERGLWIDAEDTAEPEVFAA